MRHTSPLLPVTTKVCRTFSVCAAGLGLFLMTACNDDTFGRNEHPGGIDVTFEVSAPRKWIDGGAARSGGDKDVSFTEIDGDDGTRLYLVTEVSQSADTVMPLRASRGTTVETKDKFHPSFGLSAICYDGVWPDNDSDNEWITNFAHNIRMTQSGSQYWDAYDKDESLDWLGSGRVRFFAYAPHSVDFAEDGENGSALHSEGAHKGIPTIQYTVAGDVSKQIDLLTAMADCDASKGGAVSLTFGHALTAVTVKTGTKMLAGKVTEVSLSGIFSTGTNKIGTGEWDADKSSATTFTVKPEKELKPGSDTNHYTPSGTSIADGELTFLMIPQTLGSDAKLTVKFIDELTGVDRVLTASLSGTWVAGKHVAYSISSTGILVEPDIQLTLPDSVATSGFVPEISVKAVANVYQKGDANKKNIDLNFALEWSKDGGNTWVEALENKKGAYTGSLMLEPREVFSEMRKGFADLSTMIGSESSPEPLEKGETANCYMIHGPGYYSFPTVYGNAIKNGADNPSAYHFDGVVPDNAKDYVLVNFVGHDDMGISSPYIPGVSDAVLVWQDSPGLVGDVKYENERVSFKVGKETINQGNAVIAVRNSAHTILWSWHIWVTHYDWGDENLHTVTSKGTDRDEINKTYLLTPCNLGYCDRHGDDMDDREFLVRVRYTGADDGKEYTTDPEKISQIKIPGSLAGDNTYYQWGRKDPMPGGIWNEATLAFAAGGSGKFDTNQFDMVNKRLYCTEGYEFGRDETAQSIGESVKRPHIFFMHDYAAARDRISYPSSKYTQAQKDSFDLKNNMDYCFHNFWRRHWHGYKDSPFAYGNRSIMNYWDSQLSALSESNSDKPNGRRPVKTIYDPCPAGFCVGNPNVFTAFGKDGKTDTFVNSGIDFIVEKGHKIGWTKDGIKFYATGLRDMGTGYNVISPFGNISNPAFSCVTFIVSTAFGSGVPENATGPYHFYNGSTKLAYFDNRSNKLFICAGTNNSYGFTVRPIKDEFGGYVP